MLIFSQPCKKSNTELTVQKYLIVWLHSSPGKLPNIMLSNNCTGEVLIDNEHVCASQWDDGMSDKLCDRLNCGKAIYSWATVSAKKKYWHFSCTGKETLLWQCGFKNDSCINILSVACKGESCTYCWTVIRTVTVVK